MEPQGACMFISDELANMEDGSVLRNNLLKHTEILKESKDPEKMKIKFNLMMAYGKGPKMDLKTFKPNTNNLVLNERNFVRQLKKNGVNKLQIKHMIKEGTSVANRHQYCLPGKHEFC
jgi:hypothetical protein